MVKMGGGKGPKAPDTSGVQRAHEGLMRSHEAGAQQAASMGGRAQEAVGAVQQQGQFEAEQAARKERLDVEMAKGGLEFTGEGPGRKVEATEAAAKATGIKQTVTMAKAETEAQRAAAYELSQQTALIKAGYTVDGELTEDGRTALKNLGRDYKKRQKLFVRVLNGDQTALVEAKSAVPQPGPVGDIGGGTSESVGQMQSGLPDEGGESIEVGPFSAGPAGGAARIVASIRAGIDHSQLKFVVNSKGEMPEDVMDDSPAWQAFHGWKANVASMLRSGRMMVPPFKSIKERNRFLNEAAARQVLSGFPLPGSMADPSMTQGLVAAQGSAGGQADDGTQPPDQALGDVSVPPRSGNPAAGPLPNAGGWGAQQ